MTALTATDSHRMSAPNSHVSLTCHRHNLTLTDTNPRYGAHKVVTRASRDARDAPRAASVPFLLTQDMKRRLRIYGYSAAATATA